MILDKWINLIEIFRDHYISHQTLDDEYNGGPAEWRPYGSEIGTYWYHFVRVYDAKTKISGLIFAE